MTRQEKIMTIRGAVMVANSKKYIGDTPCPCESTHHTAVSLADVLVALRHNPKNGGVVIDQDGLFGTHAGHVELKDRPRWSDITKVKWETSPGLIAIWDIYHDDLIEQSEATLLFLSKLV